MIKFIRTHFALSVGIALPILLVLILALSSYLPQKLVAPPQYDFYYATNHYYTSDYHFKVLGDKIVLNYKPYDTHTNIPPKLFRYYVSQNRSEEILFSRPKRGTSDDWQSINVVQFDNYRIDTNTISPDQYQFQVQERNVVFPIFSSYHKRPVIKKAGRVIPIDNQGYSFSFLGWIIPASKDPHEE